MVNEIKPYPKFHDIYSSMNNQSEEALKQCHGIL